ncbi:Chromosome partition protein Smc [Streptococcus infantarius subsp. infantarius]|nr:Chromosome partition protein Smc [Streptococcus infantarius subsp. infantarius]
MITFLDERDVEHGALATIKVTNAVNGERSLTGEIESGDYVLTNIERGWRLRFDDEFYVVTYAKPIDDGKATHVTFDAVHQFFWDFDKSSVHEQLNDGSHTVLNYLDFIFADSGYTYTIDPLLKVYAFEKQSFGYKSRLNLFNDIITASGVEFQVNGKVVRILEKTGTDLSTVVRKNFNMNELGIEKHIGDFVTYQKGFGAWVDENDHTKGRLVTEYTSPLASVYGKLEAEPLVDERYTQADNMIAALKANVDNSYSLSIRLDMEDLTRAGYEYTQPRAGDYIMAINETLDFQEKIRIVSFTSEYDVSGQLVKHEVTCNDIGVVKKLSASYNLTKEQAKNASDSVGKAVEMANKALVSADGKSTVYFGNEFPKDEPKGTLHKGDSLYLTVGDTTKMYYWTGADWEELPIVNDVEAFKEQIADELKDVPNREEFENKIAEELANSKAEIETQIETAKTQAESNAKEYADTINEETAKVAELANAAADEIKADLVNVKNNLTATSLVANNAQAAVDEAKQDLTEVASELNTAKQDLANSVTEVNTKVDSAKAELTQAKQDLQAQASQLTAQANAQSELTNRVSSVEETANGTKTTVSELSKTVAQNGKDITSVTARTKVVEDDMTSTKTTLSQVQTTADGANQKTATLETGLNGLNAKFETLKIGSRNYFKNSKSRKYYIDSTETQDVRTFIDDEFWQNDTRFTKNYVRMSFDIAFNPALPSNFTTNVHFSASPWYNCDGITFKGGTTALQHFDLKFDLSGASKSYKTDNVFIRLNNTLPLNTAVSLENFNLYLSAVVEDYSQNEADIESKVAEYKQTAEQNYASLQSNLQTLDSTVKQNKSEFDQTAQGFSTRIESLETYKDGETTRANQYFESAKTETARQLTAERTAIANNYVAKSTYTSDVTGMRNDLTATTTTANITKTNLANYQASNDKAVANLQSNLQTANGNISSLQTKVEAVPGQITSAVSAVEGKIPTSASQRNLVQGTSDVWSPFVNITTNNNWTYDLATVTYGDSTGIYAGTTINIFVYLSADEILLDSSISPLFFIQGAVIDKSGVETWTDWNKYHPFYNKWSTNLVTGNNYKVVKLSTKVTSESYSNINGFKISVRIDGAQSGKFHHRALMVTTGDVFPANWSPAPEDAIRQISAVSSELKQTKDGMTLLATKTELNSAKTELQSGITTATSKADSAQATANSNAQTISTHTTQISALNTGLQAKVSQSDFNTLSGRVTTAESNLTATANQLSSQISSVSERIPSKIGAVNLIKQSTAQTGLRLAMGAEPFQDSKHVLTDWIKIEPSTVYTLTTYEDVTETNMWYSLAWYSSNVNDYSGWISRPTGAATAANLKGGKQYTSPANATYAKVSYPIDYPKVKLERGSVSTDYSPSPEDYDVALTQAKSEIKQTTDAITASVSSLDKSTVKSASLTINTDGIVMKAGKSTTDVANAIGSYFSVNQNAINLFSDKINVKGNMIVDGAITSTKIASKTIDTAHLNGKIITADVISSNAITADAIKAGAVTTDKLTANSINGDRITAGTLDAAKIKAGSITASQIASGTITSAQIKTGTISAGNIATGAITTDKIAANSINSDKIVSSGITANVINGGKLQSLTNTTNFDLDTGKLFYNNNNTGVFRVEDGASTMGLKFSNTAITVNNTSRILSRVILGGDRRETTLDDGKWDQGGFTGIVAETINGVASNEHGQADTLRVIGDNVYFTHSYNNDVLTNMPAQGWKMENYSPFSSIPGSVILKPYGINYRNSSIIAGDFRLDNGDGSGYWLRATINTLKNCFGHILNGGTSSQALNAIRSELNKISGT